MKYRIRLFLMKNKKKMVTFSSFAVLFLVVGISIIFFTYSKFTDSDSLSVSNTTVGYFQNYTIKYYINHVLVNQKPTVGGNIFYYDGYCDNGTITYDSNTDSFDVQYTGATPTCYAFYTQLKDEHSSLVNNLDSINLKNILMSKKNSSTATFSSGNRTEMFEFSHPATAQTEATSDYRFVGGGKLCKYSYYLGTTEPFYDADQRYLYILPDHFGNCPSLYQYIVRQFSSGSGGGYGGGGSCCYSYEECEMMGYPGYESYCSGDGGYGGGGSCCYSYEECDMMGYPGYDYYCPGDGGYGGGMGPSIMYAGYLDDFAYNYCTERNGYDDYSSTTQYECYPLENIVYEYDYESGSENYVGLFEDEPNNYLMFDGDLWRIIGIVDGNVKIMRTYGTHLYYDLKGHGVGTNNFNEYNDSGSVVWQDAQIMYALNREYSPLLTGYTYSNDYFYDSEGHMIYKKGYLPERVSTSCTLYSCYNDGYDNEYMGVSSNYLVNVEKHNFYIGTANSFYGYTSYDNYEGAANIYAAERGNIPIRSGLDVVWNGYIGLPNFSDYYYSLPPGNLGSSYDSLRELDYYYPCASEGNYCTNFFPNYNYKLYSDTYYSYMSTYGLNWYLPVSTDEGGYTSMYHPNFRYETNESLHTGFKYCTSIYYGEEYCDTLPANPVVYLKDNVIVKSGTGTINDPYVVY